MRSYVAGTSEATNKIVILFWYSDFFGDKASCTYLVNLLGTLGVIESQEQRLRLLFGDDAADRVFSGLIFPQLGADLEDYPSSLTDYLKRLRKALSPHECQKVLAGNHHGVDTEAFLEHKRLWQENPDPDSFLAQKHKGLVANLQEHADSGKLWFEQYITQAVVDYVKDHQEIQTGVRKGNHIIVRKIPYNPDAWLREQDPRLKRYHACHCPFARSAILKDIPVDDLWCYCSGGFTKLFFDFIFDADLEVELLESVLSGGESCRFAIRLPERLGSEIAGWK